MSGMKDRIDFICGVRDAVEYVFYVFTKECKLRSRDIIYFELNFSPVPENAAW